MITDKGIDVRCRDAVLKLELKAVPDSEYYVVLTGTGFEGRKLSEAYTDDEWKSLSRYERAAIRAAEFLKRPDDEAGLLFGPENGNFTEKIEYFTPMHDCYTGHDSFITSLGYSEEGFKEIYCKLTKPGFYKFESLDVVCQPTENITTGLGGLRREPLTDISLDINAINGKLKLTQDKLLVLSIPYSTGWKAYVDGQETKTACANIMFLSVPVSAGEHEISLKYETPYLRTGACLTAAGFVLTILLIMFQSFLKRKDKEE